MSFGRFYIVANRVKDKDQTLSKEIRDFLTARGKECHIAYTDEERRTMRSRLRSGLDCLLVLGGDGTVLEAAHLAAGTGTPILGINLGKLGYLAEVESRNWEQALNRVLEGGYEIESRMMLDGFVSDEKGIPYPDGWGQALNDIVIARSRGVQMVDFDVIVDGQFLNRFSADGIIISTATGSTAYSMSAGGPIVEPKARLILLTLISPHSFNNRSIVLSANDKITIRMCPSRHGGPLEAECVFDGGDAISLHTGDRINVTSSGGTTRLLRLDRGSFLETLHRKITS